MDYSPFNKPTRITNNASWTEVTYGPDKARIKRQDSTGRTTHYFGKLFEETTHGANTERVHYIGDFAIFVEKLGLDQDSYHQFLHRDHIGSIVAKTTDKDTAADWLAYEPWGNQLHVAWDSGFLLGQEPGISTARGFTDHEHLDPVGLIHMNGRVYDPELGRFLSPDPLIQAPYNSQSYNRYSYVFNNPLSYTDPSGYSAQDFDDPNGGCEPSKCDTTPATQPTEAELERYKQQEAQREAIQRNNNHYYASVHGGNWQQYGTHFFNMDYFGITPGDVPWIDPGNVNWGGNAGSNPSSAQERGGNIATNFALLFGVGGMSLDAIGGSTGITSKGSFRFYDTGWAGNQHITTYKLGSLAKPLGPAGFGMSLLSDADSLASGEISKEKAALNTAMGALTFSRFGLVGLAYGVNDAYGEYIGAGMVGAAMLIGPDVKSNMSHPDRYNDLDRAIEKMYR